MGHNITRDHVTELAGHENFGNSKMDLNTQQPRIHLSTKHNEFEAILAALTCVVQVHRHHSRSSEQAITHAIIPQSIDGHCLRNRGSPLRLIYVMNCNDISLHNVPCSNRNIMV